MIIKALCFSILLSFATTGIAAEAPKASAVPTVQMQSLLDKGFLIVGSDIGMAGTVFILQKNPEAYFCTHDQKRKLALIFDCVAIH